MSGPVAEVRLWRSGNAEGQRLYLWCPGCDDIHSIEIENRSRACWDWDGDVITPTVSPSIKVTGIQWEEGAAFHKPKHNVAAGRQTCCHSFVKKGKWEFLGDCTHILKGQTVPMVPLSEVQF